jgi:membrane-associated protein
MRLAAAAKSAGHGIAGGAGVAAGLALLLPMEAGVPIPVPADLLMLAIGARVSAGDVPLPVAALAFEVIAIVGTGALFLAARGPGNGLIRKFGPRLGLTGSRLERATGVIERRGRAALAVGRALPGLRTVTVIAAGAAGLPARRALPALLAGSTFFLQLHLFLGYFLGSAALHALRAATGPALAVLAAVVAGGIGFWLARRRRRRAIEGIAEAVCPACVTLAYLAEHSPGLSALVIDLDGAPVDPAAEPGPPPAVSAPGGG